MAPAWRHLGAEKVGRPTPRTYKPRPSHDAIRRAGGPGDPATEVPRNRREPPGRALPVPGTVAPVPRVPALPPPGRSTPQSRRAHRGAPSWRSALLRPTGRRGRAGPRFDTERGPLGRGIGVRLLGEPVKRANGCEQGRGGFAWRRHVLDAAWSHRNAPLGELGLHGVRDGPAGHVLAPQPIQTRGTCPRGRGIVRRCPLALPRARDAPYFGDFRWSPAEFAHHEFARCPARRYRAPRRGNSRRPEPPKARTREFAVLCIRWPC